MVKIYRDKLDKRKAMKITPVSVRYFPKVEWDDMIRRHFTPGIEILDSGSIDDLRKVFDDGER